MKNNIQSALIAATLCLPALAGAASSGASSYPQADKPIHFVVGFPAGSTIDNVSRVVLDDIRARSGAHRVGRAEPAARPPPLLRRSADGGTRGARTPLR